MSVETDSRIRAVTAVLGPTNTGKTHLAIERMLGHETGMIGLPLRLLAREVYDKIVARVGAPAVALITGEEKIKPEGARYWVCTVEAMPPEIQTDFLAIDEIQLCADPERGHVFTDRLLHARGRLETLMLGAATIRDVIAELIPGANFITRGRLSKLTYAGEKKITKLPPRSAVVAFSATEVYAIAELMRRQRGGAAVVLGALSPRTRNAQVALFQSGQVDFLVATDAIGMGLNLDVDHVALAGTRKFDGMHHRDLTPAELGQIAGRAGRHMKDGTFGVTGGVDPLTPELVERLENHLFDPIKHLQWRARDLDFSSIGALQDSLRRIPREQKLQRARMADDVLALETLGADRDILDLTRSRADVTLLWDVCQIPDYRKISSQNHAELLSTLYKALRSGDRVVSEDWIAAQVAVCNQTEGDIDTLSQRLAFIRTWTYIANRPNWLKDQAGWQERTRAVEDALSDALHEQLTQRFVDERTSALVRGMRDKDELSADIAEDGSVTVEKHFIGRLRGFRFAPETQSDDLQGKASRAAAAHVLAKEMVMRARRVAAARSDAFKLSRKGEIIWRNDPIARLAKGDTPLKPLVVLEADEHLSGPDKEKVLERLNTWITELIADRLKSLVDISKAEDVTGLARGIAFRMTETFGVLRREQAADELKTLDQNARASLRKYGVRFGAFNVFFPLLLKPAAAELALILRVLNGAAAPLTLETLPEPPKAGLTSVPVSLEVPAAFYETLGYQVCGPRAVRIDMLERLADMIRPLLAFRAHEAKPGSKLPNGSTGDGGFLATPQMMSILGCSPAELGQVLETLGFRCEKKPLRAALKTPPAAVAASDTVTAETAPTPEAAVVADVADEAADGVVLAETGDAAAAEIVTQVTSEPALSTAAASDAPIAAAGPPDDAVSTATSVTEATPAAALPASDNAAPVPPAEDIMVDVWRPRRRHQPQRHQQRPRDGAPRADGRPPHQGRGAGQRWNRDGKRGDRPPAAKPTDGAAGAPTIDPALAAPAADAASTEANAERGGGRDAHQNRDRERRDRRDGEGAQDARRPGGDRRDRGERRDQRSFGDNSRQGQRRDDRRGFKSERPPQQYSAGPQKQRGGPDPDSPFAALSALKTALDQRNKDDKPAKK